MLERLKAKGEVRRKRVRRLDSITNSMDVNLSKLLETVKDRGACCPAVHGDFILQMRILSLRIKNLSKVTELSRCRLRYETQASVTPQPMLAPYPPSPNPASSALPCTQVWVDQLAASMILQKIKALSSCSSFLFPPTHP